MAKGYRLDQTGAEVQQDLNEIEDIKLATQEKEGLMSPEDKIKLDGIESGAEKNAPNTVVDPAYVHSDNNFSDADKEKLDGIESGAEANVVEIIRVNGVPAPMDGKAANVTVPTKLSQMLNDSAFVSYTTTALVNYYLKSETYSKAEVQALIAAIQGISVRSVNVLPEASAATKNIIFLVPSTDPQTSNVKDEYLTIDVEGGGYGWEQIGSTAISLDGYVTDEELTAALQDYVTSTALATALAGKQDVIDSSHKLSYTLLTDTPTIPDAQIQSDWNQSDDTKKDFIKNKPTIPTVTGKADKVSGAVNGNFAGLDSNGNLTDSGKKASDFATSAQGGKADTAYQLPSGGIPEADLAQAVATKLNATEIIWATYGTTTASEIRSAITAGKLPVCVYNNRTYVFCGDLVGSSSYNFLWFMSVQNDQSFYVRIRTDNDTWQANYANLEVTARRLSSWQSTPDNDHYPSEKLVKNSLDAKQPTIDSSHKLDYGLLSNTPTIPDAVEPNPTVPSGTTPTSLSGLKIGSNYYDIDAGGGTVTDVTVGGSSVVSDGVAVIPAIPTVEALTSNEIDTLWTNN